MLTVLFVEDELDLAQIVSDSLQTRNFNIWHFSNGQDALGAFLRKKPDIVLLDIMMPQMDGFTLAQRIREYDSSIPIIFLTARTQTIDVIRGFEIGANDYIKKPFSIEELIARINAQLKNNQLHGVQRFILIGQYTLDTVHHTLKFGEKITHLSFRESELLKLLYDNRLQGINRRKILTQLWNEDSFFTGRSLDVFVSRLRKHLIDDPSLKIINIRGVGYQLVV
ncbi:DNA-binding response regulator, OmpR family, contains REC and winged-helix (wHTH) domain [bacterium A37T11]|nr:DNA-binding response regulator, OmpR family, contains REC and winged-helix (wHTH) domain [bacterium A37T11]